MKILVYCDHKPLKSMLMKDTHDLENLRLQNFLSKISHLNNTIKYIKGLDYAVADLFSRMESITTDWLVTLEHIPLKGQVCRVITPCSIEYSLMTS